MFNLPPGMKSRNPGTKKIALETPVRTHLSVTAYSGDPNLYLHQCYNATKKYNNITALFWQEWFDISMTPQPVDHLVSLA